MRLIELFLAFLQIGAFSIGGGYATIPLIQNTVLEQEWLSLQEFHDIITISQMTPGPLAVNTSTFVGIRIAGLSGAIIATLGCILTGIILTLLMLHFFNIFKTSPYIKATLLSLRASSTGLILSACFVLCISALWNEEGILSLSACLIFIANIIFLRKYKINPIYLIFLSGIVGIMVYK